MTDQKIRVGIIGAGRWAKYGPIPVLQGLDDFEIVAISSRSEGLANQYAAEFGVPLPFDDSQALIEHPDVDLVLVLTPAHHHEPFVRAAIEAGKDVYSEWPLTTTTHESEALLVLAEAKGVRHVVGLQRRLGPAARYFRDLVRDGYVGRVRSARLYVSMDGFGPIRPQASAWTVDAANFTNVLSIYGGHFLDTFFQILGPPNGLTAAVQTQFPLVTIEETGQTLSNVAPDEAMVIGTLERGGLFSVQIEGAKRHGPGLQVDVTGTDGVLKMTNQLSFRNKEDNTIYGANGEQAELTALRTPASYHHLPTSHLDASVADTAYLYAAYVRDRRHGTSEATTFKDAVKMHKLIDQITSSATTSFAG